MITKCSTYTLKYCSIVNKNKIIKFVEIGGIGKKNKQTMESRKPRHTKKKWNKTKQNAQTHETITTAKSQTEKCFILIYKSLKFYIFKF